MSNDTSSPSATISTGKPLDYGAAMDAIGKSNSELLDYVKKSYKLMQEEHEMRMEESKSREDMRRKIEEARMKREAEGAEGNEDNEAAEEAAEEKKLAAQKRVRSLKAAEDAAADAMKREEAKRKLEELGSKIEEAKKKLEENRKQREAQKVKFEASGKGNVGKLEGQPTANGLTGDPTMPAYMQELQAASSKFRAQNMLPTSVE